MSVLSEQPREKSVFGHFVSIVNRYMPSLIVLTVVVSFFAIVLTARMTMAHIVQFSAEQNASTLAQTLVTLRRVYTDQVISKLAPGSFVVTHDHHGRGDAVPLPATLSMDIGGEIAETTGTNVKLYSPYPFPTRAKTGGLQDQFQTDAWAFLNDNPQSSFTRTEMIDGQLTLRVASADVMSVECVACHNSHLSSPFTDWQVGDVRGILEVQQPIGQYTEEAREDILGYRIVLLTGILTLLIGFAALVFTYRKRYVIEHRLQGALNDTNHQLAEKVEELDQFAYRCSHDLKGPLSTIKGLSHFIQEDLEAGDLHEVESNLIRVNQQANRLENVITDLLTLARADHDDEHVELDLRQEIKLLAESWREAVSEKDAHLDIRVESTRTVSLPRTRIHQVLENLVRNAVKYSDPEKLRRFVRVQAIDKKDCILLIVSDNGLGIPEEHQADVFQKFKRVHSTSVDGTGLGLSIVKKHVDKMNGEISFTSSRCGSTFTISIPIQA